MRRNASLIYKPDTPHEKDFPFSDQVIIGRRGGPTSESEGRVRIKDPAVSGRHCVIRQTTDGRFYIRDESRNGTRVSGRRLIPNVEVEIQPGDKIQITGAHYLVLNVESTAVDAVDEYETDQGSTRALVTSESEVTILVGDIAGYTTLNQTYAAADVFKPVGAVFAELETIVNEFQGSIKEYQGDAIFAFWEKDDSDPDWHTVQACRAALALRDRVDAIATDPAIWTLPDFPLSMEWALTTGHVLITAIGGDRPTGLAMVGDSVNYAFRLEKLASDQTGKILVCQHTESRCRDTFEFRSIGEHSVKGRSGSEQVFALDGIRADEMTAPVAAVTAAYDAFGDD